MPRGQSHPGSHKSESRIRTESGEIKSLPNDLRADLSEQRIAHGHETMWRTMIQASRLGVRIMRRQSDVADEIVNSYGNRINASGTGRNI